MDTDTKTRTAQRRVEWTRRRMRRELAREPRTGDVGSGVSADDDTADDIWPLVRPPRMGPDAAAGMPTDRLERDLIDLAGRLAAGTYELLVLVGEFDHRRTWALRGALSCAAWLADLCDIEISTARAQVGVARAMRDHPSLDAALRDGDISYTKARRLVPYLDGDNDVDLVRIARQVPAGHLGTAIATWMQSNEDQDVIEACQRAARFCSWRTNPDGTVTITARLTPAAAGAVCAVIDTHVTTHGPVRPDDDEAQADVSADTYPALSQQRADALVTLLTASADAHDGAAPDRPARPTVRAEVVVHVTEHGNRLPDGTPLGDHAVGRMLPDAFVSLLLHDTQRHPVDASPRRRLPTRRQQRIIDELHPQCAQPGCGARTFLQYDHIQPYTKGGPTVIANLQRLCGPHNRAKAGALGKTRNSGNGRSVVQDTTDTDEPPRADR